MAANFLTREDQARIILVAARRPHAQRGWEWDPTIENGIPVINAGSDIEITADVVAAMAHATALAGRGIPCNIGAVHDAVAVLRGQAQLIGRDAA